MQSLHIDGKHPISGRVTVSGNKNAVLPMIAAAMLTDEEMVLHNVPDILDVRVMLEIAAMAGAEVAFHNHTLRIKASALHNPDISRECCSKIRTSMLFAGPLAIRCGTASLWPPGGDVIGRRRLDGHFYGLRGLGMEIEYDQRFTFKVKRRLHGRELFLDEASVTATEQIITAAATARGVTVLRNAASEPHVTDLAELLIKMGAGISGLGSNVLTIEGVEKLRGAEHHVSGDHTEAGSFLALGAACGGEITINGIKSGHYWMIRRVFERLGIEFELGNNYIHLPGGQYPGVRKDFGGHTPVVADGPWPQFPSDLMSCVIVAATQIPGSLLFFEKMFESRIYFVDRLISMGANALICDPHRVLITGPTRLHGTVMSSPDIRAGMALVIAALCANGESTINSCEVIFRGYDNIVEKIQAVGGNATITSDS